MMMRSGGCANTGQAFSHGSKGESFAMAARTTSAPRGNLLFAASSIVALGAILAGCQTHSAALMYAQEAHTRELAAWCSAYSGGTIASEEGRDCIRRAWVNVPYRECFKHNCATQIETFYGTGRHGASYYARRGQIEK